MPMRIQRVITIYKLLLSSVLNGVFFVILIYSVFGNLPVMLVMCLNKKLCDANTFLLSSLLFGNLVPRFSLLPVSLPLSLRNGG